jgi:hypothetical protein
MMAKTLRAAAPRGTRYCALRLASQLSKIRCLTNVRLYLLEPGARIGTVHDAPQVAQMFGHIAPIIENGFLGCPHIVREAFEILLFSEF